MFEGQVYLLFALHVVCYWAQHIYQPQNECSNQDYETILRDIRNDIVELKRSVEQLQSIKESEPGNNVAFHAQLATSVTDDYVIFSHVITNEGTAYDKSSGIFTCQLCGTYVFSWTIASSQHHQTTADLLVNDVSVGSTATYPRGSDSVSKGSSTGFVVYNLKVGDKVRVILNGTTIGKFSPFSGWKLQHETGIWALTISAETSTGFDSLSVGEPHINPRIWTIEKEDTSSSLLFRNLSYGDRLFWYSTFNETLTATRSSISGWLIGPTNWRPIFMASSDSPTSSSPVDFTREYIDQTDSLLGSEFLASKSGVYLIFWNTIAKEMVLTTLMVNDKEAGKAVTSIS
uniref:Complement C1q-like protein 4 n=1 Tax=Magallana gigas TaxID=29159 RepID=K1R4J1_MAGGI